MQRIEKKLHALKPISLGAKVEVHGGFNRPPWNENTAPALFKRAAQLGKEMGLTIGEATAGGGSDGNLTAALGILRHWTVWAR